MIVRCRYCEASFQLDERRIPQEGIRARCSRCKQAFFLEHPATSREDTVETAVEEALQGPSASGPQAAMDLAPSALSAQGAESSTHPANLDDGDSAEEDADFDWAFNLDPPPPVQEAARETAELLADGSASPVVAGGLQAAEDLGGAQRAEVVHERAPVTAREVVPLERPRPEPDVTPVGAPSASPRVGRSPDRARSRAVPRRSVPPATSLSVLGWFAVSCLVGWALLGGLRPIRETASAPVGLGPLVIDDLEAHWRSFADNEVQLFVRGRLLNVSEQPQVVGESLRLVWLDEAGRPLDGTSGAVGLAQAKDGLVQLDERARTRAARVAAAELAASTLSPGEAVVFAAVVPDGPEGARRVDVRWLPLGEQVTAAGASVSVASAP